MTFTIELTTEEMERLSAAAQETGEPMDEVLHKLIAQLPEPVRTDTTGMKENPLTRLFAQWNEEDAAATEEDPRGLANGEELQAELEANRFNIPVPDLQ